VKKQYRGRVTGKSVAGTLRSERVEKVSQDVGEKTSRIGEEKSPGGKGARKMYKTSKSFEKGMRGFVNRHRVEGGGGGE